MITNRSAPAAIIVPILIHARDLSRPKSRNSATEFVAR